MLFSPINVKRACQQPHGWRLVGEEEEEEWVLTDFIQNCKGMVKNLKAKSEFLQTLDIDLIKKASTF